MIPCKTILDELPLLLWVSAADPFDVLYFNQSWHDYTEVREEDVKNGWAHIVHPDDLDRVNEALQKAKDTTTPYQVEVRLLNGKTHKYNWFLSKCVPIIEGKELIGWVGYSTDINFIKVRYDKMETTLNSRIGFQLNRIQELEKELQIHLSK